MNEIVVKLTPSQYSLARTELDLRLKFYLQQTRRGRDSGPAANLMLWGILPEARTLRRFIRVVCV
jgi:hypothetical protein